MRVGDLLAALRAAPVASLADKAQRRGVVVVAPHQDDESLGCGGLIAQATSLGLPVRLVFLSDGAGSHPGSTSHPPDRLRDLREGEARTAAHLLGLPDSCVHFLRLPDRFVPSAGAAARDASARIAQLADEVDAGLLLTTWPGDPHCDHKAAWSLARDAARQSRAAPKLVAYPVWGWTLEPDAPVEASPTGAWRLDIRPQQAAKAQAIAAHLSQTTALIDDDPGAFRLEQAMIERFLGPYEYFLEDQL